MFRLELPNTSVGYMNGNLNRRKLMHRAKAKSLRISVVIVAAFIIWWTPYYAMMIIFMFLNPDDRVGDYFYSSTVTSNLFCIGLVNVKLPIMNSVKVPLLMVGI